MIYLPVAWSSSVDAWPEIVVLFTRCQNVRVFSQSPASPNQARKRDRTNPADENIDQRDRVALGMLASVGIMTGLSQNAK